MSPPTLTHDRIGQHVVNRRYGFAPLESILVGEWLIAQDPEAVREAGAAEAYLVLLDAGCEDPVDRFERLTGRHLDRRPG